MIPGIVAGRALTGGGGVTDPYWANVVSLLHFDGTDASIGFIDEKGKVWNPTANAQIDTAIKKFGTGSGLFDDKGSYISSTHPDFAFGTGDFTVEGFVNPEATPHSYIFDFVPGNVISLLIGGNARFQYYDSTTGTSGDLYNAGPLAAGYVGVWTHIAITRQSGMLRAFLGGVQWGEKSSTRNVTETTARIAGYGGAGGAGLDFKGNLDDFRITKGIARYTSSFTPPASSFPNS